MNVFNKKIVATASILAAVTIGIGAFGAHGLKNILDPASLNTFETGVRYQMYHAIALLVLGLSPMISLRVKRVVFWIFLIGIILFSGSIYLLALNGVLTFDTSSLGFLTPIGGLFFITGWFYLAYGIISLK